MQREFQIRTQRKFETVDITAGVAEVASRCQAEDAVCSVYVPHATAAVVVNENADPNICTDLLDALDKLIPDGVWRHDRIDGNGASHIQAAIVGPTEVIPIRDGDLHLSTWQNVFLCDFDGPRNTRRVIVTIFGDP